MSLNQTLVIPHSIQSKSFPQSLPKEERYKQWCATSFVLMCLRLNTRCTLIDKYFKLIDQKQFYKTLCAQLSPIYPDGLDSRFKLGRQFLIDERISQVLYMYQNIVLNSQVFTHKTGQKCVLGKYILKGQQEFKFYDL